MSASWLVTNIVSAFLLPPLNLVVPAAAGWMMRTRWPRLGAALFIGSMCGLLALSTFAGACLLAAPLERQAMPPEPAQKAKAQAIVVLGGGRIKNAPDHAGMDMPSLHTLGRLRYGAKLHRDTGLPLLVTGGMPDGSAESEAALMARILREDFAVPVKWLEQASDNTAQNAQFSASQLKQAGVTQILLVTDAMHMPRAQMIFRQAGLQVVPAPTNFSAYRELGPIDFVPNAKALQMSHFAMHEWIGLAWYRLRYRAFEQESGAPQGKWQE